MRTDGTGVAALLIGGAAVLCCAGSLIIAGIGIGTAALVAWLSESAYALIAGAVIALLCAVLWLRRRRLHVSDVGQTVQARQ